MFSLISDHQRAQKVLSWCRISSSLSLKASVWNRVDLKMFSEWSLVNGAGCKFTSSECHLSKQPLGRKGCGILEKSESAKLPLNELDFRLCGGEFGGCGPWKIDFFKWQDASERSSVLWNERNQLGVFYWFIYLSAFLYSPVSPFLCTLIFSLLVFFVLLSLMEVKDWTSTLGSGICLWNEPSFDRPSLKAVSLPHIDCKHLEDGGHDLTFQPCPHPKAHSW